MGNVTKAGKEPCTKWCKEGACYDHGQPDGRIATYQCWEEEDETSGIVIGLLVLVCLCGCLCGGFCYCQQLLCFQPPEVAETVQVMIPYSAYPGKTIEVQVPKGRFQVVVPPGYNAGDMLTCEVPKGLSTS